MKSLSARHDLHGHEAFAGLETTTATEDRLVGITDTDSIFRPADFILLASEKGFAHEQRCNLVTDELHFHVVEVVTLVSIFSEIIGVGNRDDFPRLDLTRDGGSSGRQNKPFDTRTGIIEFPVGGS